MSKDPRISAGSPGLLSGVNLKIPTLAWRAATFGQPLVGAAYVAAALGLAGYKAGPWLTRTLAKRLSPSLSGKPGDQLAEDLAQASAEDESEQRRTWGGILAALGALGTIGLNWRSGAPGNGLFSYAPMVSSARRGGAPVSGIAKTNSMPDLSPSLPLGHCINQIYSNPELEPYVKEEALTLLHSFNSPPEQPINGGNLIGQAIATGQSAARGMAVGWLTAQALGLPNPRSTAILGAVANTLGPWSALATGLVLGD